MCTVEDEDEESDDDGSLEFTRSESMDAADSLNLTKKEIKEERRARLESAVIHDRRSVEPVWDSFSGPG